jgi:hypothetical protein
MGPAHNTGILHCSPQPWHPLGPASVVGILKLPASAECGIHWDPRMNLPIRRHPLGPAAVVGISRITKPENMWQPLGLAVVLGRTALSAATYVGPNGCRVFTGDVDMHTTDAGPNGCYGVTGIVIMPTTATGPNDCHVCCWDMYILPTTAAGPNGCRQCCRYY